MARFLYAKRVAKLGAMEWVEISHLLHNDSFILALRRFIAHGGQVKEIRSDNGTKFIGGEKELAPCYDRKLEPGCDPP